MLGSSWSRGGACLLLIALGVVWTAPPTCAQISESRESSGNPVVEIFRSTIYGGLAGLVIGSALALALDNDDNAETVRWSFVGGTFLGCGYGIYYVSTRSQPRAMIEHRPEGWALAAPEFTVAMAPHSDSSPGASPFADSPWEARAHLVSIGF